MFRIDGALVKALEAEDFAYALVRVSGKFALRSVARRMDTVAVFPFINAVGIRCDMKDAERLSGMPGVESVTAQARVTALSDDEAGTERGAPAYAEKEAENEEGDAAVLGAARRMTGRGVTLCVMDTGVSPHSDLSLPRDRIVAFEDRIAGREFPYDDNGHGTFVAGVAAGSGFLSGGPPKGLAPAASVVGVKVIGASGETGAFKILEGMQWLFDNCGRLGVKVAVMSFGAQPAETADPLKLGAEMLVRRGVTVVCAAGNSGIGGLRSPGISPEVITVGAVDDALAVAPFSSSGVYQGVRRPDVYAPGVHIKGIEAGGTYSHMTGTSASAPLVAGACCLLHEAFPRLYPRDCKRLLLSACRKMNGIRVFTGFG